MPGLITGNLEAERELRRVGQRLDQASGDAIGGDDIETDARADDDTRRPRFVVLLFGGEEHVDFTGDIDVVRARGEARVDHRRARSGERASAMGETARRRARGARPATSESENTRDRQPELRGECGNARAAAGQDRRQTLPLRLACDERGRCNRSRHKSSRDGFRPCRFEGGKTRCYNDHAKRSPHERVWRPCDGLARMCISLRTRCASTWRIASLSLPAGARLAGARAAFPAILLIVGAVACFAVLDGIVKFLACTTPCLSSSGRAIAVQALAIVLWLGPRCGARLLHTRQPALQLARGAAWCCLVAVFLQRAASLPLAEATAINYTTPTLVILLVGRRAEGADDAAALGVRRRGDGRHAADRAAGRRDPARRGAAVRWSAPRFYAAFQIMTRKLSAEDPRVTLFYPALVRHGADDAAPAVRRPDVDMPWTHVAAGGSWACSAPRAISCSSSLSRRAPASGLTPFTYMQIVCATLFGLGILRPVSRCRGARRDSDHRAAAGCCLPGTSGGARSRRRPRSRPPSIEGFTDLPWRGRIGQEA